MEILHKNTPEIFYFPYGIPITEEAINRFNTATLTPQETAGSSSAHFARILAMRMNEKRDFSQPDTHPARSGELLAMMLLNKVFRYLIRYYCGEINPAAIDNGLAYAVKTRGADSVNNTLPAYVRYYPPLPVQNQSVSAETYLADTTANIKNQEITFTEILVVQLAHENRAMRTYRPLFDNGKLKRTTPYDAFMAGIEEWFAAQPAFSGSELTLLHLLREPLRNSPDSLEGQLEYIMRRWRAWLPATLLEEWLITRGVLQEETMMRGPGPGPAQTLAFGSQDYEEPEAFSQDEDWMPHVVLVAKLAYVWLDQLSAKYERRLSRLDDIPDEELDQLAHWGFNALWLIGVWERSPASSEIKQRMGNPEAAASAYSLYDYTIAADLGGEEAYRTLAHRARLRGIRLAGDMVPNHVGLYSRWVIEHPDWFIQDVEPPFPNYQFTGPDLSGDSRVSLFIEDGYWNNSDAAVTFKRVDNYTGETQYIYHGNDGTSMPWNDTAQLNFMLPQVREAVINAIVHVAHKFPIIRFDAAMTLAKRHYQRLWFPRPGEGGAIPSRAEHGMDKASFDAIFPVEFWREVVDRIAAEAPDTLLLAEAFWLMEGYFVRTLGMHRVYNSAFMNMLKEEDNANYRQTLKNVLEFSPAVLQRFVNFMNNPDEDTAQAQFGKSDKYFGVAAMMVTMPGLPMFGHGQIEGFSEKYGMEYRRAYYQETPEQWLIKRHEREIFPLMRKRYLFSGAANFALFDFMNTDGWVDENVFAYTNSAFDERALIIYNNSFNATRGVLHTSTAINMGRAEEQQLQRRSLVEALALNTDPRYYTILHDMRTGLEYLRHTATIAEAGLHFELQGYEYKAFISLREVCDNDRTWGRLHALLGDKGVPDMQEAYLEMYLSEVLNPFRALMTHEMVTHLLTTEDKEDMLGSWRAAMAEFLKAVSNFVDQPVDTEALLEEINTDLQHFRAFMLKPDSKILPNPVRSYLNSRRPQTDASADTKLHFWRPFAVYCLLRRLGQIAGPEATIDAVESQTASWMRSWLFTKHIGRAFEEADGFQWRAQQDARLVYACMSRRSTIMTLDSSIWGPILYELFEDTDTKALLQVNIFSGRRWLNKEALEQFLYTLFLANTFVVNSDDLVSSLAECYVNIQDMLHAAADTGYDFDWMLSSLK